MCQQKSTAVRMQIHGCLFGFVFCFFSKSRQKTRTQKLGRSARLGFSARPRPWLLQCELHDSTPTQFVSSPPFGHTINSTEFKLVKRCRLAAAISVASRCALIVFGRTMSPCLLSPLCVISLPGPCFLSRSTSQHIRLDSVALLSVSRMKTLCVVLVVFFFKKSPIWVSSTAPSSWRHVDARWTQSARTPGPDSLSFLRTRTQLANHPILQQQIE